MQKNQSRRGITAALISLVLVLAVSELVSRKQEREHEADGEKKHSDTKGYIRALKSGEPQVIYLVNIGVDKH